MREIERLCFRRARARAEAVVSGVGGSPKMKNLIKAPMRMTTDSCPRRNPSVNDKLQEHKYNSAYVVEPIGLTRIAAVGPAEVHLDEGHQPLELGKV